MYLKKFVVASVSSNTNSFGLYGVVIVAKDGQTFEVACNRLNVPEKDEIVKVWLNEKTHNLLQIIGHNCEIPTRLKDAPKSITSSLFKAKVKPNKDQAN